MESELVGNPIAKNEELPTRSKSVSVLLTSISIDDSVKTLLEYVSNNKSVDFFLRLTGILWSSTNNNLIFTVLQYSWNIVIRMSLLFGLCFTLYFSTVASIIFVRVMFIAVFLQCCTLWFSLNEINRRLHANVSQQYALYLNQGLKESYFVMAVAFAISALPLYTFIASNSSAWLTFYSIEFGVCLILTATMYFISTDCAYALSLLDQLIEQQKLEQLTFEQYSQVRKSIVDCQSTSTWTNNSIVIVALLDIAAVMLYVFTGYSEPDRTFTYLFMCALLLKEIPFLFVVYWQVAQVNEKSAKFMSQLAVTRWNVESNTDNERMAIFISAQGSPICMSLAGMKLKRKDLAWQFALWCFAFAVSIVRSMLVNKA